MTHPGLPIVDVTVGGDADRLVLAAREPAHGRTVLAALRKAGITCRARPAGATVTGAQTGELASRDLALELCWQADARRFAANRDQLDHRSARLRAATREVVDAGTQAARDSLHDVDPTRVLDDHQAVNVAVLLRPECFGLCVFDEQGTGKTITGLFAAHGLFVRDEIDMALVVSPKSMVAEWPQDLRGFLGDLYSVNTLTGSIRQRRRLLSVPPDVLICNFEAVVSHLAQLTAVARSRQGRCLLIVDESFMVKNPDASRSRALRSLREHFGRAVVLCGTPAPNSAHDLVGQFDLADFGATFTGVDVPVDRPEAQQAIGAVLADRGVYLRSTKNAVLPNLPSRSVQEVEVVLAPEQDRAYRAALRDLVIDLRATDDETFLRRLGSFAARRAALLQICSHPGAVVDRYSETPGKLRVLDRLLPDLTGRGEKVVLWSFYRHSLQVIAERYAALGLERYDGSITDVSARREAVRRFQQDPDCRLLVANPAAAGAGLTLHSARYAIYESMSNQAAHYLQSLDRVHRRGQQRPVKYVFLVAGETLEIGEWQRMRNKERAARDLLGDPGDLPPTRQRMLDELLAGIDLDASDAREDLNLDRVARAPAEIAHPGARRAERLV